VEKVTGYGDVKRLDILVSRFRMIYGKDPSVVIRVPGKKYPVIRFSD
jgi:hypothetical protein